MTILAPCKLLRGRGERLGPSLGGPLAFASLGGTAQAANRKSNGEVMARGVVNGGSNGGNGVGLGRRGRQVIPVLYILGR